MKSVWHEILALDAQYNTCRFPAKREPYYRTLYLRRRSQLLREYGLALSSAVSSSGEGAGGDDLHTAGNGEQAREEYLQTRRQLLACRYGPINPFPVVSEPGSRRSKSRASSVRSLFQVMLDADLSDGSQPFGGPTLPRSASMGGLGGGGPPHQWSAEVVPTRRAEASRALAGNTSLGEGYAFSGIQHIFDHHSPAAVTRLRFPNNDATRLALASEDGSVSICRTWPAQQESRLTLLKGHQAGITDLVWTMANDFLVTVSRDGTACLWNVEQASCTRVYGARELGAGELLACDLQPVNNNLLVVGGSRGLLQMVNLSTGKTVKAARDKMPGKLTALTFETAAGECLWVGTSQGIIQSYKCEITTGRLTRARRLNVAPSSSPLCPITSLAFRAWVSREARDPCLLGNASSAGLLFLQVVTKDGQLALKKRFPVKLQPAGGLGIRSCFCPLISFRQGACVMTGSEDCGVYVFDVQSASTAGTTTSGKCITQLQGHVGPVLDVAVSCDELVMASADATGMVILWKRSNEERS